MTLYTALFNRKRKYHIDLCHDGKWRWFAEPLTPGKRACWSMPHPNRASCVRSLRQHFNSPEGLTP